MNALALVVLAVLLLAVCCEARLAHKDMEQLRQSYKTNLSTFVFNNVILSVLSVSSLLLFASRFSGFGILNLTGPWKIPLSFVLLDITLYSWHRACHVFDGLWMFHKVHHSDLSMNVTTAFRVHLVEVFLTTVVKAIFIVVLGVDSILVLVNEMIITLFVIFHHSNMTFRHESVLGLFIVTPAQHRVHHSVLREEHDNNYGAVFPFWDKLFGTFIKRVPDEIGLKDIPHLGFIRLFLSGLTRRQEQRLLNKKDCFFCHFFGKT